MVFEHDFKEFPELTNNQMETLRFISPHEQIEEDFYAEVVKVHDGDTVTLRTDFRDFDFPLRMIGIDSPEMNAGGQEAQQWLENQVLNKEVRILIDKNNRVGKYGRLLGNLISNGMNLAQEELHLGLAVPFGSKNEGEPDNIEKTFSMKQWLSV